MEKKEKINLVNIKTITVNNNEINSLSVFPSGNLISISNDKSIKLYNNNFTIIQIIRKAHKNSIQCLSIKDDNNFITSSNDNDINIWIKKKNKFILNYSIQKAHKDFIYQIIYCKNNNIISYSKDLTFKIWEKINNIEYQNLTILKNIEKTHSILLLDDKNILITLGINGTKIYNYNNLNLIKFIPEIKSKEKNAIGLINEDKIIFGGGVDNIIKIISLNEKKIIKEIDNNFQCYGICVLRNKGFFLICGYSRDIKIYRNDNFNCVLNLQCAHNAYINGFNILNDGSILSHSFDKTIKIWKLQ
jgi:WD40 repeat protein